jgi:serine/threonine protein kinase
LSNPIPSLQPITGQQTRRDKDRIIHRDLKPVDLILTNGGVVKILDFGLAKYSVLKSAGTGHPTSCRPADGDGFKAHLMPLFGKSLAQETCVSFHPNQKGANAVGTAPVRRCPPSRGIREPRLAIADGRTPIFQSRSLEAPAGELLRRVSRLRLLTPALRRDFFGA